MDIIAPDDIDSIQKLDPEELMRHIILNYHDFSRKILAELQAMFGHTGNHDLTADFSSFKDNFELHLMKEEKMLFPFIAALSRKKANPGYQFEETFPPSVALPVRMMLMEHESHGRDIDRLAQLVAETNMADLRDKAELFFQNVRNHIYVENTLLFPAGISLENGLK